MIPSQAFKIFTDNFSKIFPEDRDFGRLIADACKKTDRKTCALAREFILSKLARTDDEVSELWLRSDIRFYPTPKTVRTFTEAVVRIIDESLADGSAGSRPRLID